jgi:hypothetical protein
LASVPCAAVKSNLNDWKPSLGRYIASSVKKRESNSEDVVAA